jgi:hypothetical protein
VTNNAGHVRTEDGVVPPPRDRTSFERGNVRAVVWDRPTTFAMTAFVLATPAWRGSEWLGDGLQFDEAGARRTWWRRGEPLRPPPARGGERDTEVEGETGGGSTRFFTLAKTSDRGRRSLR